MAKRKYNRKPKEQRSTLLNPLDAWIVDALGGGTSTASKQVVNSRTALWVPAWLAAIQTISEDIAKLPICFYRITKNGKERITDHPLIPILNWAPNDDMTAFSYWETLIAHALAWSGGYAEIRRYNDGSLYQLYPLDPTRVSPLRDTQGNLVYKVSASDKIIYLPQSAVFHIHGPSFDGVKGYDKANLAKEVIGNALSALEFSGSFFGKGCNVGGVFTHPNSLDPKARENLRQSLQQRYAGASHGHQVMVLEEGMKFEKTSVDPEKSQMIDSLKFSVTDIARIFRIPAHKLGDLEKSAFTNIQQQSRDYIDNTLRSWTVRMIQEIHRKLLMPSEKNVVVEYDFDSLLETDSVSQATYFQLCLNNGIYNLNEVRAKLGESNIGPDGDKYYRPANLVPIDKEEEPEPAPQPEKPPDMQGTNQNKPGDNTNPNRSSIIKAHKQLLAAAVRRLLNIEQDKVKKYVRSYGSDAKVKEFYLDHMEYRLKDIEEVISSFYSCIGENYPQNVSVQVLNSHIQQSLNEWQDMDKVNSWLGNRPDEFANEQIERIINGK